MELILCNVFTLTQAKTGRKGLQNWGYDKPPKEINI